MRPQVGPRITVQALTAVCKRPRRAHLQAAVAPCPQARPLPPPLCQAPPPCRWVAAAGTGWRWGPVGAGRKLIHLLLRQADLPVAVPWMSPGSYCCRPRPAPCVAPCWRPRAVLQGPGRPAGWRHRCLLTVWIGGWSGLSQGGARGRRGCGCLGPTGKRWARRLACTGAMGRSTGQELMRVLAVIVEVVSAAGQGQVWLMARCLV